MHYQILKSLNLESLMVKLFALSMFLALPLSAQALGDPIYNWKDTVIAKDTVCTTGIHVVCHVAPKVDTVFVNDVLAIHATPYPYNSFYNYYFNAYLPIMYPRLFRPRFIVPIHRPFIAPRSRPHR